MASLMKTSVLKFIGGNQGSKIAACVYVQNRGIKGRAFRESLPEPPKKPAPFDYINKDYTWIRSLFDRTTHRFDDNTKVVVVEGPIAACKTQFASMLASDLGMKHYPEANMDLHYLWSNGVDLRTFDNEVPESCKTYDHRNFCMDPKHVNAANFQIMTYSARFSQYVDALAHLMNTGDGVVLERSPYSDFVFVEAMYSQGYISKAARSVYYEIRETTLDQLMRPHLVIYLDIPVDRVMQLIQARCYPHEVQGTALTRDYLCELERQYKNKYLRDIEKHAELLVYDWSGGGDVEVVVEDIERLNFDKYNEREDPKMFDWRLPREVMWADQRMLYSNQKYILMNMFNVPRTDVPELLISADDALERDQVLEKNPKFDFIDGYSASDGSLLLKSKMPKYSEQI